jgi:HSP20 family molecular chaperone IbpA
MSTQLCKQEPKHERTDVASVERTHSGQTYSPRVDILETENELLLLADMPGVAPENLDIQFENRELRIHGKVCPRHQDIDFLYGEYGIGDFYRTFTVGEMIDSEKISAELHQGVLTLHLPKTEAVKPRKIMLKSLA